MLVGVSKVKIKVGDRRISGVAHGFNILDDRGTGRIDQSPLRVRIKIDEPKDAFTRTGYNARWYQWESS